jgi:hypothetical protein
VQAPYGIWPPLQYLSTQQVTGAPVRWYVDPTSGSDIGTFRGTQGAPLRTIQGLRDRLQSTWSQVPQLVSLRNANYPWTTLRPTLGGAQCILFADEAWDPTVYTVQVSGAAGAGTTASSIVGVFVADAQRGRSIRFTSGAAAGQYRTIQSNTVGALVPSKAFSPAPAQNDTYQIFTTNVQLLPTSESWTRVAESGVANLAMNAFAWPTMEGYGFVGLRFVTSGGRWQFEQGRYNLYGVEIDTTGGINAWRMTWASVFAGLDRVDGVTGGSVTARMPFSHLGTVSLGAYAGWGLTGAILPQGLSTGTMFAFLVGSGNNGIIYADQMNLQLAGGSMRQTAGKLLSIARPDSRFEVFNSGDAVLPELLSTGAGPMLECGEGSIIIGGAARVETTGAGPVFRATGAGYISISNQVTGQAAMGNSFEALRGGHGLIFNIGGAAGPAFGRAVDTDYDNGNGAPQNKTFFAALGAHLPEFTDGSSIIRYA